MEAVAAFLRGKIGPVTILHSGKLRARQTAEVLAASLTPGSRPEETDGLEPLADPKVWAARAEKAEGDLMVVGHLPHLERLASLLLTGEEGARPVAFRMGGVVCLEKGEGGWAVRWAVTPDLLGLSD